MEESELTHARTALLPLLTRLCVSWTPASRSPSSCQPLSQHLGSHLRVQLLTEVGKGKDRKVVRLPMKAEGHRMRLVVPPHVAPTMQASKCMPVTSSTATRPSSALIMWQEGLCSDSVTGKQIWVMLTPSNRKHILAPSSNLILLYWIKPESKL